MPVKASETNMNSNEDVPESTEADQTRNEMRQTHSVVARDSSKEGCELTMFHCFPSTPYMANNIMRYEGS